DWFEAIGAKPAWFEMDLRGIDRLVIEAVPAVDGAGWYGLDDLTYTIVPARGTDGAPRRIVLDFEDTAARQVLTGSNYGGLRWETGTGDFGSAAGVPAPQTMETEEPKPRVAPGPTEREGLGTAPEQVTSFQGPIRGDSGQFSYPPDTCGAVGPQHFVSLVNRNASIYDRANGQRLASVTLSDFFAPYSTGGDPRVLYDQYSDRWIAISSSFSSGRSIQVAVSLSSDPTGAWFKTQFLADGGSDDGCWPDYPTLGVSADGIYVTTFMVSCGMTVFAIDKAPLIAAAPSLGTILAFRGLPFEGAIQPVHSFGSVSGEYLISRNSSTTLRVRQVAGAVLVNRGTVSVPFNTAAADAPALGSSTPLDTVDTRLMNAVYRDGSIWTTHTVDVSGRAACRWYEVDVQGASPTLQQVGTVSDPVLHYFFPSIMVNARGDALLGFSGTSATQYAGAYFTGRNRFDPPNEMGPAQPYRAGSGPQNNLDQYGRNRWGDYSLSSLDPNDEQQMWTIQAYGHTTNIWGTYIAEFSFGDCNNNGVADSMDITAGTSIDCNTNGTPDECELDVHDCNASGIPDDCEIAAGSVDDCNANGIPDTCDVVSGVALDCNANGIPDVCDVAPGGASDDCDVNGVPDECQLAGNDCNGNGRLDVCDSDDLAAGMVGPAGHHACPDEPVTFSVAAPGLTAYQWIRNGTEVLTEGAPFSGVTSAELTIAPAGAGGDLSTYSCRVSAGCITAESSAATLDVLPPQLDVALISPSPITGCAGGNSTVVFAVTVDDPLDVVYQWNKDGVDLVDSAHIIGSQTAQLEISGATGTDSGAYTCQVWNACIDPVDAVSTTGILAFANPAIAQQPADRCAEPGEDAAFNAEATGPTPLITRWYEGAAALTDGAKFSGTTTTTLTVHDIQLADDGRQFRLRAAVPDPFCSTYSDVATLTVAPAGQCPDCRFTPGDMDGDGDFDLADLQAFAACFGADIIAQPACACANVAADDQVVNIADWIALQVMLTGPQ
ncbi:MAG TPA: immunoglobulin domain-containing protein, partial [Phycisphaerae bacterium]|nr:immunoglobulin domain-containing protein [Phycisphaerae bacterium]